MALQVYDPFDLYRYTLEIAWIVTGKQALFSPLPFIHSRNSEAALPFAAFKIPRELLNSYLPSSSSFIEWNLTPTLPLLASKS